MPPYAGLDELFHVARLAFTHAEGRSPSLAERSVPRYLAESAAGVPGVPPAFGLLGSRWTELVARAPWPDPPPSIEDVRTYVSPNYEAQQPALFYLAASRVLPLIPARTRTRELLLFRIVSAACAMVVVLAAIALGARGSGSAAFVAASLVAVSPAWLTLVARSSNDAFACALLALGLALSAGPGRHAGWWLLEGCAWGAAIASKVYVWPAAALVPLLWRRRGSGTRALVVGSLVLASGALTMWDLAFRTGSLVGAQEFARAGGDAPPLPIPYGPLARVFVSSAIWPGAQHGNAMTPLAMVLYVVPVLGLVALGLSRTWSGRTRRALACAALALALFVGAQVIHAYGFLREAWARGTSMPAGGAEGWYLWSLAPALVPVVGLAVRGLRRHRLALTLLVSWCLAADVATHEGALFQDYAGATSPAHRGVLFRWGRDPSLRGEPLRMIGAGHPSARVLGSLRAANVTATLLLMSAVLRRRVSARAKLRRLSRAG